MNVSQPQTGDTKTENHSRIDWAKAPIVFVTAPTCPDCGSPRYQTRRSLGNGDGSRTKLVVCSACGVPFKVCVEFPDFGNVTLPVRKIVGA
jgi:hypothetical protein